VYLKNTYKLISLKSVTASTDDFGKNSFSTVLYRLA